MAETDNCEVCGEECEPVILAIWNDGVLCEDCADLVCEEMS